MGERGGTYSVLAARGGAEGKNHFEDLGVNGMIIFIPYPANVENRVSS